MLNPHITTALVNTIAKTSNSRETINDIIHIGMNYDTTAKLLEFIVRHSVYDDALYVFWNYVCVKQLNGIISMLEVADWTILENVCKDSKILVACLASDFSNRIAILSILFESKNYNND